MEESRTILISRSLKTLMQCSYCRYLNPAGLRRCIRCGRELAGAISENPVRKTTLDTHGTGVTRGQSTSAPIKTTENPSEKAASKLEANIQTDQQAEVTADTDVTFQPVIPRTPSGLKPGYEKPQAHSIPRTRHLLPLRGSSPGKETLASEPSPQTLLCDLPVAAPLHRLLAGTFDLAICVLATAFFAAVVLILLGTDPFVAVKPKVLIVFAVLITAGYHLLWAVLGSESPGQLIFGLRVVRLDGTRPSALRFIWRCLATLLSASAGGLGLLWCMFDLEHLAWQDYMSGTFVTPVKTENISRI